MLARGVIKNVPSKGRYVLTGHMTLIGKSVNALLKRVAVVGTATTKVADTARRTKLKLTMMEYKKGSKIVN